MLTELKAWPKPSLLLLHYEMMTRKWVPLSFSSPCRPKHILVLDGIRDEKYLWENDQMSAVSFVSNLALRKCREVLYTGFPQSSLCPVCMLLVDFVKFGWTFPSGSTCEYKGSTVFKVWLFESQSYPVPGKEITKVLPLSFAGYNLHRFVDTTVLLFLCSLLWKC